MTDFAPKKVEEAKGQIEDTVAGLEDDKVGAEAKFKEKMEKQHLFTIEELCIHLANKKILSQ